MISGLPAGEYRILATWPSYPLYASNAPFQVFDGNQLVTMGEIDQRLDPNRFDEDEFQGLAWQQVGQPFHLTSPYLMVRLTNNADGAVAADAIRIERFVPPDGSLGGTGAAPIVINEVLAHSDQSLGDWIELHNTTAEPIDIGNWYLSDSESDLTKFRIPANTVIPTGGYITFTQFAEFGNPAYPGVSVPFQFSELGGKAVLSSADGSGMLGTYRIVQSFPASDRDVTFGRYEKTSGDFDFAPMSSSTMGAANSYPRIGPVILDEVMYNPGPGNDEFIELQNISPNAVPLYDILNPSATWMFTAGINYSFPQGAVLPRRLGTDYAPRSDRLPRQSSVSSSAQIFGPYTGALNDAGENLELSQPGAPEFGDPSIPDGFVPYYLVDRLKYSNVAPG